MNKNTTTQMVLFVTDQTRILGSAIMEKTIYSQKYRFTNKSDFTVCEIRYAEGKSLSCCKTEYLCLHLSPVKINIYDYYKTVYHENQISVTASDFMANLVTGTHRVRLDHLYERLNTSVMHTMAILSKH